MQETSLFDQEMTMAAPLASRVRPTSLEDFVGQKHLIGEKKFLREMIDKDQVSSMIFWGPPGVGKTTLAEIIAKKTKSRFITFSAVMHGIKEIRKIMNEAEEHRLLGERTIVFIDEIHRFNKAQQDAFLPYVEKGSIILIGATTENPSFEVNSALLSRTRVFILKQLEAADISELLEKVLKSPQAFPDLNIEIAPQLLKQIAVYSNGDARTALNTLEMLVINSDRSGNRVVISGDLLEELLDKKTAYYDKDGEEHYNIISALHKSMRNSDADSAIYWLGRMIDGGEDPVYIARRLIRFASEDIGLADNSALNLAVNTFQACRYIGLPECDVHLTQCVIYLSLAPKSNAVYKARMAVKKDIKATIDEPVPLHLRNASTSLMKEAGYGKGYQLAHFYEDKLTTMPTRPESIEDHVYYKPTQEGREAKIKQRLDYIKEWKKKHDTRFSNNE
ncbi:replication-associated recombination protein A [Streptococcus chenjunshii]|uniref:Replication-associated recombination protein A n=1 Tax=Streptococcus chenjunshii TaxID=2173853 RepID=A0A372KLC6_9STRE|nr:replication-associated recombination protein A [Streptococcus chenjunshii]AXQ79793.1 replication-associated recombination protein A [Streptococcus chenjunshii]RFU51041.1 replication-associated recombination protein A [Streptococcus chenjunshii]RFU53085.1 replication-associated recombination protein A [Streptococcus chenjunshii]